MDIYKILEIGGLLVGLAYLVLIILQNIWCWPFGILSSLITVFLFFHNKLYLESVLNVYYVCAGFYGWYYWNRQKTTASGNSVPVVEWPGRRHILFVAGALLLSWGLSFLMQKYTDSPRPHIDTFLAVFSFLATFMEARKVLSAWLYWFILNGVSVWLQFDRQLPYYALLSLVYTVMCLPGFLSWKKTYDRQKRG